MVLLAPIVAVTLQLGVLAAPAAQADPRQPTPSAAEVARAQQAAAAAAGDVGAIQARLANAQSQLRALLDDAERAVEDYNGALYLLDQAKASAAAARDRADVAQADLAEAQAEVGRFAAASYRMGGDLGGFAIMLDADGPKDLMDQASDLANVADSKAQALDRVAAARIVADVLAQQATVALQGETDAAERVRLAKVKAEAKVQAQRDQVGGLERLTTQLQKRLAKVRAAAGSLSEQRKQGLAAAADRRAARERARAAAEAAASAGGSNNGGSSGNASGGTSSHWSPSFVGGTQLGTKAGADRAIAYARKQLGKPYLYAAAGPDRFDCSGLTMMAWRAGGVALPHWSVAQFSQAKKVPASQARPGDLVFYAYDVTDPGTIHHVALYVGGGRMIHAPHTGDVVREADVYSDGLIGFARP